eukprot:1584469-Ditylum_brightwellii.AAC.1
MWKVVKYKSVDMAEGQFNLVEALLKGYALTNWMEYKYVETTPMSKNPDGTDTAPKGISPETFKICIQELKHHYFLKNLAHLQKAHLCNHAKKPNKLSIKNTSVQLCNENGMLTHFPAPGNNPMAEDEMCNIIYCIVKHNWCNALHKSCRTPTDLSLQVDNDSDKKKKPSSHGKINANNN